VSSVLNLEDFLRAFLALFIIIDPAGNLVVFHVLARRFTRREKALAITVAMGASALLLAGFGLGGTQVLDWLGVSQPSFRVAAGLLLLPTVYGLAVQGELPQTREGADLDPVQVGLVPLAMPLLAGPGALASVVTYSGSLGQATTLAAAGAVLVVTALGFAAASTLFQLVGGAVMRLLARIIGLALFAIATEFVMSGVITALRGG
jgi:multiple antibiotic resistance protein